MEPFYQGVGSPDPPKNHQKIDHQFIQEIVRKYDHFGVRLDPESYKKSQNDIPGSTLENHLKKVAQHFQTQPLETMKSSVWCIRNHRFRFSSFAAKCLEKWSQGSLIWDTLATEINKRPPRNTPKNNWEID